MSLPTLLGAVYLGCPGGRVVVLEIARRQPVRWKAEASWRASAGAIAFGLSWVAGVKSQGSGEVGVDAICFAAALRDRVHPASVYKRIKVRVLAAIFIQEGRTKGKRLCLYKRIE